MSFSTVAYSNDRTCVSDCLRVMQATGQITKNTPQAFLEFARREIARPGLINVLLIHSPGGSVNGSMAFGRALRKLGTIVIVARAMDSGPVEAPRRKARRGGGAGESVRFLSGTCASACVYALAGGARRVVPPQSRVAVHRMAGNIGYYDPATREYQHKQIYAGEDELRALTEYIHAMGVSTDLVATAESVPHEHARILSGTDMARLGLAAPRL